MRKNREVFEMLTLIMQLGISMLVPIMMCTLIGVWLGKRAESNVIPVVGFVIGAVAGLESVYKIVKKYIDKKDDKSIKKDE
ncbi:MAG: AtpZ/AtpI family protein [Lachnospiraceae bacterium]|nr:AtpZ/AtpI family protein [Lachnospiraceae bacterium]